MNILYHLTFLTPKMPACVAELQEVTALRDHFGGELNYLNPNSRSPIYIPRLLFGLQQLRELRQRETDFDIHHLYNPDAFAFPVLHYLRRPVIYSISGGVGSRRPPMRFLNSLAAVVVADERSLKRLKNWGSTNCMLIRTGIDISRFTYTSLPLQKDIYLMVGSAPWTREQFHTKGVEALLETAKQAPYLRLIFLWRGTLAERMKQRIEYYGIADQVQLITQQVDVNSVLSQVHASIALATTPGIIKAYPHSLLESLAAGKPVLVSQAIPMADYVKQTNCGEVIETITPTAILAAVETLSNHYKIRQKSAQEVGKRDFSFEQFLAAFARVYENILPNHADTPAEVR